MSKIGKGRSAPHKHEIHHDTHHGDKGSKHHGMASTKHPMSGEHKSKPVHERFGTGLGYEHRETK